MLRVTLEVDNQHVFDRMFSRFGEHTEDLRFLWPDVAADFREIEQEQFSTQGAHSHTWQPLSRKYGQWKAKKYPGKQILELDGTLWQSLTRKGAKGHVEQFDKDSLAIGTSIHYAKYHQRGTRKMPARKVIDFTEADKMKIAKTIHRRLVGKGREAGFTVQRGSV